MKHFRSSANTLRFCSFHLFSLILHLFLGIWVLRRPKSTGGVGASFNNNHPVLPIRATLPFDTKFPFQESVFRAVHDTLYFPYSGFTLRLASQQKRISKLVYLCMCFADNAHWARYPSSRAFGYRSRALVKQRHLVWKLTIKL